MTEPQQTLFGVSFSTSDGIAVVALLVALWSVWEARKARVASLPKPIVSVDFEAFDSRNFNEGRLFYYHNWAVANTGGSTVTLRGFATRNGLPIFTAAKDLKLLNAAPRVTVYRLEAGQFEDIGRGDLNPDDLEPVSLEEFGSLNIAVPSGETKSVPILFKIESEGIDANAFMLSLEMLFGDGHKHDAGKMIRVADSKVGD